LRREIKKLTKEIIDGKSVTQELINDVVKPEVDKVEKMLKSTLSRNRFIKGTTSLTYATATLGMLALSSFTLNSFLAFSGVAAFNLFANENAYLTKMDELETNPYYLLWKLKK